jgi:antitoxin MazE
MASKLQKWGNSLGVRIPKSIIEQQDGKIVIFPAKKKFSLSEMMDQVTPENLHGEDDFKSEGNEVW